MRKGKKITIPRKAGYPNIKAKVLEYDTDTVTARWGVNVITVKRKYL